MPLIAINLSQAALSGIKALIDSGKYLSLESFIEVAAFNQLALEKSGGIYVQSAEVTASLAATTLNPKQALTAPRKRQSTGRVTRQVYLVDKPTAVENFEPVVKPYAKVAASEVGPPALSLVGSGTYDERIFGQVNRLLPLKLVCRWVMRQAQLRDKWLSLTEISEALADDTARLGSVLEQLDMAKDRKRDACLATGLPRRANGPSKDRFLGQFVARVTRGGHVFPGAICQYKLASIQDHHLGLTQEGIAFSLLGNPLLDGGLTSSDNALGAEEVQFLIRHVAQSVPLEQADIQVVLMLIANGSATPDSLAHALASHLPEDWNESEIQTHASGLVARMAELNLLRRRWHGRNVEYEIRAEEVRSHLGRGI